MTGPDSDAALVRGALSGDQKAQTALVEKHRAAVYRIARNATGDTDAAYDIAQEAFVAAFSALRRYDPDRSFRAWISSITLNKCRDWARRRTVRHFLGLPLSENAAAWIADDAALPDEVVGARAELEAVSRAIARLPAKLKDVLLLRAVEGLSQTETADALGISEKAVETRLYRARIKLAELVRGDDGSRV